MGTENHEIRFGIMAIKKGFIIKDQLIEAVSIQVEYDVEDGKHKLIGEILIELGYMEASEVNEVLLAIGKSR